MHIAIIGNGIAGVTAARYIRKLSTHKITIISGETDYFYSRTALMYIYMNHMRFVDTQPYEPWFWKKNKINLKRAWVSSIDTDQKIIHFDASQESMSYDKLILATGSKSNFFGWKGQTLDGVQGLYNYQDLENLNRLSNRIKKAVIVGGGLIGIELGEMLHSRGKHVTFVVREESYWSNILPKGESNMVNRHIKEHGFDLLLSSELDEIIGDENQHVSAIKTKDGQILPCQFVGITAGVSPNVDFIKSSNINIQRGIIINHSFETNVSDVYAIGDCAQFENPLPNRRPIEQVWYTGKMHGEIVARHICDTKRKYVYNPGPWFNSAKFLDIEYQTYGIVMPQLNEDQVSLYWEHPNGKKCIHFVYQKDTRKIIGVNFFGLRYRHETFHKWITESKNMDYVLANLHEANFDPEFFENFEKNILHTYNQQTNQNINASKKKKKNILRFIS